jgi:hypothetical protein
MFFFHPLARKKNWKTSERIFEIFLHARGVKKKCGVERETFRN